MVHFTKIGRKTFLWKWIRYTARNFLIFLWDQKTALNIIWFFISARTLVILRPTDGRSELPVPVLRLTCACAGKLPPVTCLSIPDWGYLEITVTVMYYPFPVMLKIGWYMRPSPEVYKINNWDSIQNDEIWRASITHWVVFHIRVFQS